MFRITEIFSRVSYLYFKRNGRYVPYVSFQPVVLHASFAVRAWHMQIGEPMRNKEKRR